jgi:hypothetical protein
MNAVAVAVAMFGLCSPQMCHSLILGKGVVVVVRFFTPQMCHSLPLGRCITLQLRVDSWGSHLALPLVVLQTQTHLLVGSHMLLQVIHLLWVLHKCTQYMVPEGCIIQISRAPLMLRIKRICMA